MLAWLAAIALGAEPVVRVVVGSGACAGTIVDADGRILTAYHCVAAGGRVRVHTRDGRAVWGRVRAWDVADDLAVVEAPALAGADPWRVAEGAPATGAVIRVVGHPLGANLPSGYYEGLLRWSVTSGVVAGVGERAIQFDAPVNPGNSGGPVIDAQDRIVSVVSRRLGGQGLGFGARTERVRAVLAQPARRPGLGGQLNLGLHLAMPQGVDGGVAVGPQADVAVRDRLVFGGSAQLPVSPAISAARFGTASYAVADAHVGVRQRLGAGPWSVRLDAVGGLVAIARWTGAVEDDQLAIRSGTAPAWMAGGAIAVRGVRFELGALEDGTLLAGVGVAWPGTVSVF